MRGFRQRRPSPALVISIVALFVAMGGTGYAALKLPKNSVGAKQIKKNAVTSSKVKNRSLKAGDFKAGQLPRGRRGARGLNGAPGPFVTTLPSGKTLRGAYGVADSTDFQTGTGYAADSISFPFPLASAPTKHFIGEGDPATAACPGSAENPQAARGNLCVYEEDRQNVSSASVCNPATSECTSVHRTGATIQLFPTGVGNFWSWGTWAVTAP